VSTPWTAFVVAAVGGALFFIILLEWLNYEMHRDLMYRILWYLDYLAYGDEPADEDEPDELPADHLTYDEEER
jgi:hypothetical protein